MKTTNYWMVACAILIPPLPASAQNIIHNGGFDSISSCPDSPGSIYLAAPWYSGGGGGELLSDCGLCNTCTAPLNGFGFQTPRSINNYAEISTFEIIYVNARHFIMQPTKYELVAGEEYYFEMFVSLADSFNRATHNIGVVLVDTILNPWLVLDCVLDGTFDCSPVVENTSANPLTSKTEWTKISGTFTAQGGEKYIFIGNVRPDSLTEVEYVGGGAPNGEYNWEGSGYYIDDVWLSHIDSMHYVGIEDISPDHFSIYPNPTTDVLSIEARGGNVNSLHIEVIDFLGRSVLRELTTSSKFQINLSGLAGGLYNVLIRGKEGGIVVKKVVKE